METKTFTDLPRFVHYKGWELVSRKASRALDSNPVKMLDPVDSKVLDTLFKSVLYLTVEDSKTAHTFIYVSRLSKVMPNKHIL